MAVRNHWSNNNSVHVKVSTIHTDVAGVFVEWGVEAWRERKVQLDSVWWWPWPRYEWRRQGAPPEFTEVHFTRGDGASIPDEDLEPSWADGPGYLKKSAVYVFVGTSPSPTDLGTDARSVTNVTVTYRWNGELHSLEDHHQGA